MSLYLLIQVCPRPVWAVLLVCRIPPNWIYVRECFSESHTCETAHICWPLEVDRTHNREQSPPTPPDSPNALIHGAGAPLLLRWRREHCSVSAQRTQLISFHQLAALFHSFFLCNPSVPPQQLLRPGGPQTPGSRCVRGLSAPVKKQMWRV